MKTYRATFNGRKIDAIGVTYHWSTTVVGNDENEATLRLYDRFDHITSLQLTLISTDEDKYPSYNETQSHTKLYESDKN